jgi:hypothetical protein
VFLFLHAQVYLNGHGSQAGLAWAQSAESWRKTYVGDDADGEHVIALWKFDEQDGSAADASGNGHIGALAGTKRSSDGRFGACIESFPGWPVVDERHAVRVKDADKLSPNGAFTIELWVKPKAPPEKAGRAFLIDKKYVAHHDYQWVLETPDGQGNRGMAVVLGFGEDSETWRSTETAALPEGVWSHLAFTYDGAGTVQFFLNGRTLGSELKTGRGSIRPGRHPLSLGDRVGSLYGGFPGYFDEVRITRGVREFRPISVVAEHVRNTYVRLETSPQLRFRLTNVTKKQLSGVQATIGSPGLPSQTFSLPELEAAASHVLAFALDTRIRPGEYEIGVSYSFGAGETAYANRESFPIRIAPRRPPHRMPVVMWGVGGVESVTRNTGLLKEIGFTHCLGLRCDYNRVWEAGEPVTAVSDDALEGSYRMLDQALADDLSIVVGLAPGRWLEHKPELLRIDRNGKPYSRKNICGNFPGLKKFSRNVGASVARTYGDFPAFQAALINTEVRDGSQVCFHDHDAVAFRAATGLEIPDLVRIKNGVLWTQLRDFPKNRVIPDDHHLLQYYRWFWRNGDGWNPIHSAVNDGLKSTPRSDLWTFFDPAVRAPALFGGGGNLDFISHWTYSYPDPIRIGLATDELLAMAAGSDSQQVMKMTQLIWYRSQTAPTRKAGEQANAQSAWEDRDPDAAYITIAPMHLKEAFWTKISRPVKGIMYHGWQSLVPVAKSSAYRFTHPATQGVLKELIHKVVQPLGPALMQIPGAENDVAFLESFSSEMFARRGTYGWGRSWSADAYQTLMYAHLQADIVFEETIVRDDLEGYRVLVLADCDVLPASVVRTIQKFQESGGVVVGDERLCPAITADVRMKLFLRTKDAAVDKRALLDRASSLRQDLAPHYQPSVETTVPDVLPYRRRFGTTDYIFAINDRREFGSYVGQHGLVMENGLPSEAVVTIRRQDGFVYDLLEHREVTPTRQSRSTQIPIHLDSGGGALLMMTQERIEQIRVEGPKQSPRSTAFTINIAVNDAKGRPIDAVVPLEIDIRDPSDRPAELSGFYGAAKGQLEIRITPAPNDTLGVWTVKIRDLATGKTARHSYRLTQAD